VQVEVILHLAPISGKTFLRDMLFPANVNGQTKTLTFPFLISLLKKASYSTSPMLILTFSPRLVLPKAAPINQKNLEI
jgi:hypothetical protein